MAPGGGLSAPWELDDLTLPLPHLEMLCVAHLEENVINYIPRLSVYVAPFCSFYIHHLL